MTVVEEAPAGELRRQLFGDDDLKEARAAFEFRCVREMDPDSRIARQFEMREVQNGTGGTSLRFTGYASVVNREYEVWDAFGPYTESIARSAFNKTLSDGADVAFLVNHSGVSMARTKAGTLQLSSDSTGLHSEATLNPGRSDVNIVRHAVSDGDLDEMSFAFIAVRQKWDEDYTHREILELSLHQGDVSVVNFGANPATAGLLDLRGRRGFTTTARSRAIVVPNHTDEAWDRMTQAKLVAARQGPR